MTSCTSDSQCASKMGNKSGNLACVKGMCACKPGFGPAPGPSTPNNGACIRDCMLQPNYCYDDRTCKPWNCKVVMDEYGDVHSELEGGKCNAAGKCVCNQGFGPGVGGLYCGRATCSKDEATGKTWYGTKVKGFYCPPGGGSWARPCSWGQGDNNQYCPPDPVTGLNTTIKKCETTKGYPNVHTDDYTGCKLGEQEKCSKSSQCSGGCCARPVFWPTDGLQCLTGSKSRYGCV